MRRIYRGKRIDNGEWVEGYLLPHEVMDEMFIVPTGMGVFRDEKTDGKYHVYAFEVIPETVGQYIGLDDKNGEPIFEGDIIKYEWNGKVYIDVVVFDPPCFTLSKCFRWSLNNDEVIGNIHDNPYLAEDLVRENSENRID